jgi:hypothetical protein
MKQLYTLICAGLLFSLTASAQYSATYTAVLPGLWHNNTPAPIWSGAEPSQICNNCLVNLTPAGGGTITMNGQISLTGNSLLVVGPNVTLKFQPSTATAFNDAVNPPSIIVLNSVGSNNISLASSTSVIDATALGGTNSNYDGVFTANPIDATTTIFQKQIGASPNLFSNNNVIGTGPAIYGNMVTGPNNLNSSGTLPIILSSFTATLNQDVVNLAWTTSMEVNASHIGIQRSVDAGAHWSTIGTLPAKNNTTTPTNYTFADNKPAPGASEYRLQLVDLDGKYTYSSVRTVRNGLIGGVSVFPNPAHDIVNVTLGGNANENLFVRLYNQSGQLLILKNVANAGGTTVALPVAGYPAGNYVIVVNSADGAKQVSNVLISK